MPEIEVPLVFIPTNIFIDRELSVLEIITEYLKEDKSLSYHEIAHLLNRDDRTIWTCYNRAKHKRKNKRYEYNGISERVPSNVIKDRALSVLESVTEYLKDSRQFSFHEIALLLNRDDRTIWTCYNRAKKKRNKLLNR